MKVRAVLARTTTDNIKSKILSNQLCEIVFDCYISPEQFAELLRRYFDDEFELEFKDPL